MKGAPTVLVIMGVAGAGKTTLGELLAARLDWSFKDGDELHPQANIEKMSAGIALDDADRGPWLVAVARRIGGWIAAGLSGVIACSALKRAYRDVLRDGHPQVRFIYLCGNPDILAARLSARRGHFMPPSLLASQLAALEPPMLDEQAIVVGIDQPLEVQIEQVVRALAGYRMSDSAGAGAWP